MPRRNGAAVPRRRAPAGGRGAAGAARGRAAPLRGLRTSGVRRYGTLWEDLREIDRHISPGKGPLRYDLAAAGVRRVLERTESRAPAGAYDALLSRCASPAMIHEVDRVYATMLQRGVEPQASTYGAILALYLAAGMNERVLDVYGGFAARGGSAREGERAAPSAIRDCHHSQIYALCRLGRLDEAMARYRAFARHGSVRLQLLMELWQLAHAGGDGAAQRELAAELWARQGKGHLGPDHLLRGGGGGGRIDGTLPSAWRQIAAQLVEHFFLDGDGDRALGVASRVTQDWAGCIGGAEVHNAALRHCRGALLDRGRALFGDMQRAGVAPDEETFDVLISNHELAALHNYAEEYRSAKEERFPAASARREGVAVYDGGEGGDADDVDEPHADLAAVARRPGGGAVGANGAHGTRGGARDGHRRPATDAWVRKTVAAMKRSLGDRDFDQVLEGYRQLNEDNAVDDALQRKAAPGWLVECANLHILALCRLGRLDEAMAAYSAQVERSVLVRSMVLRELWRLSHTQGDGEAAHAYQGTLAEDLWRRQQSGQLLRVQGAAAQGTWLRTMQQLVDHFFGRGDIDRALQVVDAAAAGATAGADGEGAAAVYNAALRHCRGALLDRGRALFGDMQRAGVAPDEETFDVLISNHELAALHNYAEEYRSAKEERFPAASARREGTVAAVAALVNRGDWEGALHLIREAEPPGSGENGAAEAGAARELLYMRLRALCGLKRDREAVAAFGEISDPGTEAARIASECAARAGGDGGDSDGPSKVLGLQMLLFATKRLRDDRATAAVADLLAAVDEQGVLIGAPPNDPSLRYTVAILMDHLFRAGAHQRALDVLGRFLDAEEGDRTLYNTAIRFCRGRYLGKGRELFAAMCDRGIEPDISTFQFLMHNHVLAAAHNYAHEYRMLMCESGVEQTDYSYALQVRMCKETGDFDGGTEVYFEGLQALGPPLPMATKDYFEMCWTQGHFQPALDVFQSLRAAGHKIDGACYEALILMLDDWEHSAARKSAERQPEVECLDLYVDARASGARLTDRTLAVASRQLAEADRWDEALAAFGELIDRRRRSDFRPEPALCNTMFLAAAFRGSAGAGVSERCVALFRSGMVKLHAETMAVLKEMVRAGSLPDEAHGFVEQLASVETVDHARPRAEADRPKVEVPENFVAYLKWEISRGGHRLYRRF